MFLFYVNPILIAAAVIPAIVLLRFVYKEDRLDKESPGLLLSLVIFGILSTFAAIVTEQIGEAILGILLPQSSTAYNVLLYFVVVALSEEGFKYLLLKKRTWYSSEFNCQFDGVVYAVFVALGFALWENISYVLMYGLGHGGCPRGHGRAGARVLRCVHGALSTALPSATTTLATSTAAAAAAALPCSCRCCCTARTISSQRMSTTAMHGSSLCSLCCSSPRRTAGSKSSRATTALSTTATTTTMTAPSSEE